MPVMSPASSDSETTATDVGTITTSGEETTIDVDFETSTTDVETPKTHVDENSADVKKRPTLRKP